MEIEKNDLKIYLKGAVAWIDDIIDEKICKKLIEHFDYHESKNNVFTREESTANIKKDKALMLHKNSSFTEEIEDVIDAVKKGIHKYEEVLSYTKYCNIKDLHFTHMKIQKTFPMEGYHVWHVERNHNDISCNRALVYTIFLNDVKEGGETEFLLESLRVPAKRGRLCIFPADYPYVHRGNPPLSGVKYILTSWLTTK